MYLTTLKQLGHLQARGRAAGSLAGRLIGEAPLKAARDVYDRYLRSVAVLLGGEAGPEEVQASAGSIWDQLASFLHMRHPKLVTKALQAS